MNLLFLRVLKFFFSRKFDNIFDQIQYLLKKFNHKKNFNWHGWIPLRLFNGFNDINLFNPDAFRWFNYHGSYFTYFWYLINRKRLSSCWIRFWLIQIDLWKLLWSMFPNPIQLSDSSLLNSLLQITEPEKIKRINCFDR